jgi:uncharacterized protein (DUF885 family)
MSGQATERHDVRKRSAGWPVFLVALFAIALQTACLPQHEAESSRLHTLFDREWSVRLDEDPLLATRVGEHAAGHLMPAVSAEDQARRNEIWRGMLEELHAIDVSRLDETDRISYAIFERQLEDRIAGYRFKTYQIPIDADSGFHTALAELPRQMPLDTVVGYENYLARLRAFPTYFEQQIANMREGLARGMTVPRAVLEGYDVTIESHVVEEPRESLFFAPFADFPTTLDPADRQRLRAEGEAAIRGAVVPAYRGFHDFMIREYRPNARNSLAASELPDGNEYYLQRVRHHTTLDVGPDEIHRIGLREVERIRGEMQQIIDEVGFEGGFEKFLQFLRTDPRFYARTPDELLMRASWLAKRMDGRLPSLFRTLPRQPYGVEPVPDHLAPKYTAGRYVYAARGSKQPGYYWVNTHDLKSRPLYTLEALTLHEAVPGHHLQIALGSELEELPEFRRFSYISAFAEGWGLYSEWLGLEAGFYEDPYSDFGRLTYEMWRACRLVVDTGIHAQGWTREQAREYLASNTALSRHEILTEIDRYIAWPGQALAYKMGELRIRELRRRAERELGERFDVREFHDAVLLNGAVPLPVLERLIEGYIERAKRTG